MIHIYSEYVRENRLHTEDGKLIATAKPAEHGLDVIPAPGWLLDLKFNQATRAMEIHFVKTMIETTQS